MESALFTLQQRESTIEFDGRLALVFFTRGCNFQCPYCHNPELIPCALSGNITYDYLGHILDRAKKNWVDSVCITGGEPTLQSELPSTAAFIKERGLALKIDTQESLPENLSRVIPFCDYIAMDYKTPLSNYSKLVGVSVDPQKIQRSLELIDNSNVDYEIRTTVVPGIHKEEQIKRIAWELKGIKKYVLQSFIPRDNLPDTKLRGQKKIPRDLLNYYANLCREYIEDVEIR